MTLISKFLTPAISSASSLAHRFVRAIHVHHGGPFYPALDSSRVELHLKQNRGKLPAEMSQLTFGGSFTDHMMVVDWFRGKGWTKPVITPFDSVSIHPAAPALHYAVQCFEGIKVFKDQEGNIREFRMMENMRRFSYSCERTGLMSLTPSEQYELYKLIKMLVLTDQQYVPDLKGYSLYIRPVAFGTQPTLGVIPPGQARVMVICSPVGPYYPSGFKPVQLLASETQVRAWPGSSGGAKVGSNYGPTILPFRDALKKGFSQLLWLFPQGDDLYITEAGTMNLFIHMINKETGLNELITPPLSDLILPGITRRSVIELVKGGCLDLVPPERMVERHVSMKEVVEAANEDRLLEIFGSGTAALVCPVETINFQGEDIPVPLENGTSGPVCEKVLELVQACQAGRGPQGVADKWSSVWSLE